MRGDFLVVNLFLELIGQQHHDPVGLGCGIRHAQDFQSIGLGFISRAAAFVEANHHVNTTVLEVQGVGMALGSITNDRHGLTAEQAQVSVGVVIQRGHPVFRQGKRRAYPNVWLGLAGMADDAID